MNLSAARRYEDLLSGEVEASPYDYAVLFKADGFFARRRAKTRFKLLQSIDPKLTEILRPQERVYWITTGTTVSIAEHFFVGWAAGVLNRRSLIFTTERVLLLEIDVRTRPRKLVSQIPYAGIASVKSTWNGMCRIKLVNGRTYSFQGVPKADRKFLAEFLAGIVQGTNAPFQRTLGIEHLCPYCFVSVPGHPPRCTACAGEFKSPKKAGLLSLLFPGVGDWYLGHRGFALLEMFGLGCLWFALVIAPLTAPPDPELGSLEPEYWITAGIILAVAHGIDAMMTHHFARKGHYPHGKPPVIPGAPPLVAEVR